MLVPYKPSQRGGYPVFVGQSVQRGRGFGSILSSVFRNVLIPVAKNVGKSLLQTGIKKTANVMRGVAAGKPITHALGDEFLPQKRPQPKKRRATKTVRKPPAKRRKITAVRKKPLVKTIFNK